MPDPSRTAQALARQIEMVTEPIETLALGLIEQATITSVSAGADAAPTATTSDDESVQVLEPYGVASAPPGQATAVLLAPGGEQTDLVALSVSSLAGRPATDAGDTALWTAAGHRFELDDDGGILITAKDGQTIELDDTGDIDITTPVNSSVTINVSGTGAANIGGPAALELTKINQLLTVLTNACNVAITAGAPVPPLGDSGAAAFSAFLGVLTASLVSTAGTTKAKGE